MPRHCSAGGCRSRDNRDTRNAGLTFHKLPKGEPRRNLWISNSNRADSWRPQTDFVYFCSKHFTPDSFELTGCSGIRRLKEDAFPTVFESFSTSKYKRKRTLKKQGDVHLRTTFHTLVEETSQQTGGSRPSEEVSGQRSGTAAQETHEDVSTSSHEPSGLEELPKEECVPPPEGPRPLSPSNYMRRLPPPPGFYLSKEHSYAQLCPLLWRRRYNEAIDSLEKVVRQLHAARRRESRLRSTVLKLRDKRLKQVLLVSQEGRRRENLAPGGRKRPGRGGSSHEDRRTGSTSESTGLSEDRRVDQTESSRHFLSDTHSLSEEEKGSCCYCGRGQGALRGQGAPTDVQGLVYEDSLETPQASEDASCSTTESSKDVQVVRMECLPRKGTETDEEEEMGSDVLLQAQSLEQVSSAGAGLMDAPGLNRQVLVPQQKLLLSDTSDSETQPVSEERPLDSLYWIHDGTEGQVVLVPVVSEDRLQRVLKMDGVTDEAQILLVSGVDLEEETGHEKEDSLSGVESDLDGEHENRHSVTSTTLETREDVREKLKEHLEGFHLQLSTEFIL
ncbi:THAP domain-containing protein 7 [Antennarius striatus]|uniref:THAP domain-containing protein 7 n=1 Tax=Antennarius striatus TaxID=241820 RepID=UPI0035AE0425